MAGFDFPQQRQHQPRYTLYVRRRDGIMRLINVKTGAIVPIAAFWLAHYATGSGVQVVPVGAKGVFVFEDEFVYVEEFPVVVGAGGSGNEDEESNTQLVAREDESPLVA